MEMTFLKILFIILSLALGQQGLYQPAYASICGLSLPRRGLEIPTTDLFL